jgi:hypothetical protein
LLLIVMLKGISTQLFLEDRLAVDQLKTIQDAGFGRAEALTIPPHFDYRDKTQLQHLAARCGIR